MGVTNPDTTNAIAVRVYVMDSGSADNKQSIKEGWTNTHSFPGLPKLSFNLFNIKKNNDELRDTATYEFWFE